MSAVAEQLRALLPPVAYAASGPRLQAVTDAEGTALQETADAAQAALDNAFPLDAATVDLASWERVLALTPAAGATADQRLQAILAAIRDRGGSSIPYFIARLAAMGADVTIDEFPRARCGVSVCGDSINGNDWPVAWRVNLADDQDSPTLRSFVTGRQPSASLAVFGVGLAEAQADVDAADALFFFANYTLPEAVDE
jgi:uncharacterized protein YmfQ (DUF2313 family)